MLHRNRPGPCTCQDELETVRNRLRLLETIFRARGVPLYDTGLPVPGELAEAAARGGGAVKVRVAGFEVIAVPDYDATDVAGIWRDIQMASATELGLAS